MPRTCLGSGALSAGAAAPGPDRCEVAAGCGGGAGSGWPEVGPPPQPAALAPPARPAPRRPGRSLRLAGGRRGAVGGELLQQRREPFLALDHLAGLLEFAGQALVLPTQPGVVPLHRVGRGRPCGAASATSAPRSRCLRHSEISEVSRPRGAAGRPCRPCSEPHSSLAEAARNLGIRSLLVVHPISMHARHHGPAHGGATGKISLPALSTQ